jgi:type IV pilus assembly protein PilM
VFRKNKSVVGLDLGSSVVKAVEITMQGPEPVVTGFARAEVPPGGSPADAVAGIFRGGKIKAKKVVTGVSGQSVVVRYVPMAKMSENDLKQAIRFETDKYLPFELEEVVLDCQALRRPPAGPQQDAEGRSGEQMTTLLAACKTRTIEERIQFLQNQGLTPFAIDVDLFALANAWELCSLPGGEMEEGETRGLALVDVGAVRTSINVLCGGETCFSREINVGGSDMTQAVARRLSISPAEAEAIKRDSQTHEHDVNVAITPVLEDLTSELSLSLDYVEHHSGVQVSEILLSGGGMLAPGTTTFIEQATGRTTRTWNPIEGLRVESSSVDVEDLEAWAPTLAVAVGLASRVRAA